MRRGQEKKRPSHLKVDVAIGQPIGTAFIQEVNVFDQQAEEGNHNLERENRREDIGSIDVEMKIKDWIGASVLSEY